jgi:AcrR family transcriptional regulator
VNNVTKRQRDFLQAAIQIVSKEGVSKLTIRNVAASVGVTEPAVYRHFPNKLALLNAMLEDLQGAIVPHFIALRHGGKEPKKDFARFIRTLFEEFRHRPAYAPFLFSEEIFHSEPQLRNKLQQVLNENITILTGAFESLQKKKVCRSDIKAEEMAFITLASIRLAVSRWYINGGTMTVKDLADQLVGTLHIIFEIG